MNITAFDIAQRFIGVHEVPGALHNPQIMSWLQLDTNWPDSDETPWCSAFVNYVAWILRLPRSKNLLARSWLQIGLPIPGKDLKVGYDIVILKQKESDPGPTVLNASGHVGFYCGFDTFDVSVASHVNLLGGNQSNAVTVASYPVARLLGCRRLYTERV